MATKKKVHTNNPQNILISLLAGGLAGAVAMLLFAPQSGKQTRDLIEEKSIQLRDQTTKEIKKAVKQIRSKTNLITAEVRERAEDLKQLGQDKLVEQLDNVSAALDTGKMAIEAAWDYLICIHLSGWQGSLTQGPRLYSIRKEYPMHITHNIGFLLLAIWLILWGLITLLGLSFSGLWIIMGLLAIAAGIFILIQR
jgi:gas vesicle protein